MKCPYCEKVNPSGRAKCAFCGKSIIQAPIAGKHINHIPNYLVQAVLVTLFCCQPFGIISIVYSTQVNTFLVGGFYEEAREASEKARTWFLAGFWSSFALFVIALFFLIIAALADNM